jgi:hypothetical protein
MLQGELPLSSALGLQVGYNSAQQTLSISSSSSNAFSLLSAISQPLRHIFELDPNSAVAQDPAAADAQQQQQPFPMQALQTSHASLTVSGSAGLLEAVVGLEGQYSPSVLSAALGLPFVLPDDLFSVASDPLLLYNAVPAVMYVAVSADVPAIGITGATSTINIQPGQQVSLQVIILQRLCMQCLLLYHVGDALWISCVTETDILTEMLQETIICTSLVSLLLLMVLAAAVISYF